MKKYFWLILILFPIWVHGQQTEFQKSETGQALLAKTDALIKEFQDQGYTLLHRLDTISTCYKNYNCVNFLNQYLTDEVAGVFCLTSNSHGIKLNGVASERSKRFVSYRWNEEPFTDGFEPFTASCISWDGILDEIVPEWYDFSYYSYGKTEHLVALYFSKPNKSKLAAWQQKNKKATNAYFLPKPLSPEKLIEKKADEAAHKKYLLAQKPESRKVWQILDSINNRFKYQDIGGGFEMDTLLQPNQTIVLNEKLSKGSEYIYNFVSYAPLSGIELNGTPFEVWSPSRTEIIKDVYSSDKGLFIRNIHLIGSIKKIEIKNNTDRPTRIWLQKFSNMYNPYYWRSKEFLLELNYVKRQEERQRAEKAKADQEAIAARRLQKIKAQGVVCSNCEGTGVEYEYTSCMLCGGDGETTEFVTGQKTIGQKLIHKSTTVSGNEVYEVRDEKALTVDGKRTVSCKICKGNGSVKSGKKHQCPVCEGKGRVY